MAIKFGRPLERGLTRIEAETKAPADRLDLAVRPRRNRRAEWARRMDRSPSDPMGEQRLAAE